jgi:hypothetical protein
MNYMISEILKVREKEISRSKEGRDNKKWNVKILPIIIENVKEQQVK